MMAAVDAAPAAGRRDQQNVPHSVTVCVVVLDRREAMARCLTGLRALRVPEGWDVDLLVVDNGSTDGTLSMLENDARVRVLSVAGTVGRARNAAVEAARGELVAFTDSDCVPDPDWLVHAVAPFVDPGVTIVQGRTVPAHAPTQPWSVTQDVSARTGLFEACNIVYRREALREVGGFGEEIGFFGEDTIAGWRVRRAGGADAFAPAAVVRHDVTTPGYRWHLRRSRYYVHWPALVRAFPEARPDLLWHRWFLRRRSAQSLLAILGLLLALRRPLGLLLMMPLLCEHRPRGRSRQAVREAAGAVLFDLSVEVALVEGSARHRTVLL